MSDAPRRLKASVDSCTDTPIEIDVLVAGMFVIPSGIIFLISTVVMFAPWEWDNIKNHVVVLFNDTAIFTAGNVG